MDGWEFKNFVLGMLFYRFISENLAADVNAVQDKSGDPDFRYQDISDEKAEEIRDQVVEENGYFMTMSQLFSNVLRRLEQDRALTLETLNVDLLNTFHAVKAV